MDNKQAIEMIKEHCYFANLTPIAKQALDKAIKSLEAIEKIKDEILEEKTHACADFDDYKMQYLNAESDELPFDDFRFGMERAIEIINKYTGG